MEFSILTNKCICYTADLYSQFKGVQVKISIKSLKIDSADPLTSTSHEPFSSNLANASSN